MKLIHVKLIHHRSRAEGVAYRTGSGLINAAMANWWIVQGDTTGAQAPLETGRATTVDFRPSRWLWAEPRRRA